MPWARTQFKWRFVFSHCLIPQVTLHHNALYPCTGHGARRKLVIQTVIAIHWKRTWCWARVRAGEEGGDRGWDAWMSSLTQQTRAWANSGDGEGQGSLACYRPWGHKVLDTTDRLNNKGFLRDIWPFLSPETRSADQKTWKATEWHFLEAHEVSTSFGGHKCTIGIRFGEKITNNYAHFPLFLHFKSEK